MPTVLVIEDNRALAENIAELFEDLDAEVTVCATREEAIGAAAAQAPDLAIVDVQLPAGASGLDLVPELQRASPHGEVILMTGNATLDTAIAAVRHGVFAYVQKPFATEDLIALGERALAQVTLRRERQALARDLASSEAIYRGVVETVDQLILGLDEESSVAFCNRFASDTIGGTIRDIKGKPFLEVAATPEDRPQLARLLRRARAGRRVRERELRLRTRRGDTRLVRWTLAPLTADDQASLLLAVGLDVTERLELERRTAQTEALATMGELTAGLAHEVRNPLNAAKLQLELLNRLAGKVDDPALVSRIVERVDVVKMEIGRLSEMLDEFLTLARPRTIERGHFPVAAVLEEVADLQGPVAEAENITIHLELDEAPLAATGDRDKIKQVVMNLVANSIEAMRSVGEGGRLTLATSAGEHGFVEVRVADTGPGLPAEMARVFEPFFTTKEAGTGLGLPVVKRIVELHGGQVDVQSAPGRGTVARFTLPRA